MLPTSLIVGGSFGELVEYVEITLVLDLTYYPTLL
jgi:hypothetical protein